KKTIKNTKEEVKVKEPKVDKQNDLLDSLTSLFFQYLKFLLLYGLYHLLDYQYLHILHLF
ncbi:MAG: hypothetical protein LRY26_00985, partial [Bacilli bacterium]|nr:hypothetical protein [Bacilli bacterium]